MKQKYLNGLLFTFLILSACGGLKPDVPAVPMTEPWASMNLPCKDNAVVAVSNDHRFNCAYGGEWSKETDLKTIALYVEELKKKGWKVTDQSNPAVQFVLEKTGKKLLIFSTDSYVHTEQGTLQWQGYGVQAEIIN